MASIAETLPLKRMGKPFHPGRLEIRWQVSTNVIPTTVWAYRVLPTQFSPTVISNVLAVGMLTDHARINSSAKKENGDVIFSSSDNIRKLSVSFNTGVLLYEDSVRTQSSRTNLSVGVPTESELDGLTTNFLTKLGITPSEIRQKENGVGPEFSFFEPERAIYFVKPTFITNIAERAVFFRRSLEGISFVGNDRGGNGWIYFASHGSISRISLKWPRVERHRSYSTVTPQTLVQWIRRGKAVHGMVPVESAAIDWNSFKSLTITKSEVCFVTGELFVHPIASLWATVDTGEGSFDFEIDCPVIEEQGVK